MTASAENVYEFQAPGRRKPRASTVQPFAPFYASQMQGQTPPAREWLIDDVLMRRSVMLFAGMMKIGKSLLAQQLLTATALGEPWLDRETVQAKSFGLFTEDSQHELQRRQADLNALYGREAADFGVQLSWQSMEGRDAVLVRFDRYDPEPKPTPLWYQLWDYVMEEEIKVVALDNARVIFGGKEIDSNQVTAFARLLVEKAIEIDGAIVLAVHPAKNDPSGFAGSGAWMAGVRAGMSLRRPPDWDEERDGLRDPRRVLHGMGVNYGKGIGREELEIRNGAFYLAEHGERVRRKRGPLSEQEMMDLRYRLLIGLKRVLQNGGKVPADVEHRMSMPERARRDGHDEVRKVPLNDLYRAQELMIEAKQIVRVSVKNQCLIRPHDGPYYGADERPWLPAVPPKHEGEVRNAAD